MVFCGIDVGHQGDDGRVGILHQVRPVATDRVKAVDRFSGMKQMCVALRHIGLQIRRIRSFGVGHIRQARENLAHPGHAASAYVRFTQQDVSQNAQHRQDDDDHDPGDPRSRIPMRPQQHPHDERDLD